MAWPSAVVGVVGAVVVRVPGGGSASQCGVTKVGGVGLGGVGMPDRVLSGGEAAPTPLHQQISSRTFVQYVGGVIWIDRPPRAVAVGLPDSPPRQLGLGVSPRDELVPVGVYGTAPVWYHTIVHLVPFFLRLRLWWHGDPLVWRDRKWRWKWSGEAGRGKMVVVGRNTCSCGWEETRPDGHCKPTWCKTNHMVGKGEDSPTHIMSQVPGIGNAT